MRDLRSKEKRFSERKQQQESKKEETRRFAGGFLVWVRNFLSVSLG